MTQGEFPQFETIATQVDHGVLTATLDRPDRLNAFNTQTMTDVLTAGAGCVARRTYD